MGRIFAKGWPQRQVFTLNSSDRAVVDTYAEWCGPCKAVQSLFRRIKTDLGDGLLSFATVGL
jgi:thiol-disulfide isomerase/thioredoxin